MKRIKTLVYRFMPSYFVQMLRQLRWKRMFVHGSQEPETKLLNYFIKPGDHVIDLGANFGAFTKTLANLVGYQGKVYSFEPIPTTFAALQHNVNAAGLTQVELFNFAVTSSKQTLTMEVPVFDTGGESYYDAQVVHSPRSGLRTFNVEGYPLDSILQDKKISFIKCDVQGHELECIRGGYKLITQFKPAWLMELRGIPEVAESNAFYVDKIMTENGYHCFWLKDRRLVLRQPMEDITNYFYLQSHHLKLLPAEMRDGL